MRLVSSAGGVQKPSRGALKEPGPRDLAIIMASPTILRALMPPPPEPAWAATSRSWSSPPCACLRFRSRIRERSEKNQSIEILPSDAVKGTVEQMKLEGRAEHEKDGVLAVVQIDDMTGAYDWSVCQQEYSKRC